MRSWSNHPASWKKEGEPNDRYTEQDTPGTKTPLPPPPPPQPFQRTQHPNENSKVVNPHHDSISAQMSIPNSSSLQIVPVGEPYGQVQIAPALSSLRRRGTDSEKAQPESSFGSPRSIAYPYRYMETQNSGCKSPPPHAFASQDGKQHPASQESETLHYLHNSSSAFVLIATLLTILWSHESLAIPQVGLYVGLCLYAFDLINARDAFAVSVWIGALVLAMASGFAALLQVDDSEASGGAMIFFLLRLSVEGMLFCAWACWSTLQLRWLYKDARSFAVNMERSLHSLIPPVSASILTTHLTSMLTDYWGADRAATAAPILFSFIMTAGMFVFGCNKSSYDISSSFAIPSFAARMHTMLLLMVPGLMHILTFRKRILSRNAGLDDLYDLIIVWAVPYLLHCLLLEVVDASPYEIATSTLFPKPGNMTLHGAATTVIISMLSSLALQYRYIIPLCHSASYQFNGHDLPGVLVTSTYLTLATGSALFALWTWGRRSTVTDELLFSEYHEDVVQLSLSASGMFLGKSFGIPWSLTPLPILAFLGLSVWVTTRMLRYLCLFLFVVHAGGIVLFNYRFAAIDVKISLAMLGADVGLIRFGMLEVVASVVIGLAVGFAVRPAGGVGALVLKAVDVPGSLLVVYAFILHALEITLLKLPVSPDFVATDFTVDVGTEEDRFIYDRSMCLMTGSLLFGVAVFSSRLRLISNTSALLSLCLTGGKIIALFVDAQSPDGKIRTDSQKERASQRMFGNSVHSAILLIVLVAPRICLTPVHVKSSSRFKRSPANGKPVASVPDVVSRTIVFYSFVVLPGTIMFGMPTVVSPITASLSAHFGGGAYYGKTHPFSEMLGCGLTLWGMSTLSFLNHYLPDGGAETLKKAAAFTLLVGFLLACSSPPMPPWFAHDDGFGVSSPYASVSSLGTQLEKQGRSRTGGWGVLSAFLATLLAVTGPLELRERRHHSGRKDKQLLLRLMVFSILFGSGVAWFVTAQLMVGASFAARLFISMACMVISFFGTVTCVLGYFLELENFDEVDQMAKVWIGGFLVCLLIASVVSMLLPESDIPNRAFGEGGWLSTYLVVTCLATFALSVVLRLRSAKSQASRGLGNLSCITSFVLGTLVLHGNFGVSGLDYSFDLTLILGMPASVVGSFLLSAILLGLDTDVTKERRSRVSRLSGGSKTPKRTLGFVLGSLAPAHRMVFPILGIVSVFYSAATYTIFLRGILGSGLPAGPGDVLANVIGKGGGSLATIAGGSVVHSEALVVAARLAGCGIWTSQGVVGPLVHLCGLAAVVPSIYLLVSFLWSGTVNGKTKPAICLPLNAIPLLLCKGAPSLRAVALVGLVGGCYQVFSIQRAEQRRRMRI